MKTLKILTLCLITTFGFAQKKLTKTSQSIKVNKDVVIDLNTSHVEIQIDTWNKNTIEVEAYIESEKLSESDLKKALKKWNLKVEGSTDKVIISSSGGQSLNIDEDFNLSGILKDLEINLADLPDMSQLLVMPEIPEMPELPEIPEFPKLPELPKGVNSIKFDYDKYQKEGEKYLTQWSKSYEKKGGKELQKRMEAWAKEFADSGYEEKMAKWGEKFGKNFEGKWAKDMEKWGEEFGEEFGKEFAEKMEAWGERFEKNMEQKAIVIEQRTETLENRKEALENRKENIKNHRSTILRKHSDYGSNSKVKKVIKIKIPKKAKLKMNVRHGELKVSSALHNAKGNISHSLLVAEYIDGSDTAINVSYSPVTINTWNLGALNLNFVDKANIKNVNNLVLNAKSSNITLEDLTDTAIIDGSFGDLKISNLSKTFHTLNLVLENSDAKLNLPKSLNYNLYFKGNKSKYNNKTTTQKTVRHNPEGEKSKRTISVNAKYSNLVTQ